MGMWFFGGSHQFNQGPGQQNIGHGPPPLPHRATRLSQPPAKYIITHDLPDPHAPTAWERWEPARWMLGRLWVTCVLAAELAYKALGYVTFNGTHLTVTVLRRALGRAHDGLASVDDVLSDYACARHPALAPWVEREGEGAAERAPLQLTAGEPLKQLPPPAVVIKPLETVCRPKCHSQTQKTSPKKQTST